MVPGIVVSPDGAFRRLPPEFLLPVRAVSEVYRALLLRLVRSQPDAPHLPPIPWSKQWVVNCRRCEEGPGNVLRYLARYTRRGPLPESNILSISDEQIAFRYVSHRTRRPHVCKLTPDEFLRRYLQHTLPPGFHRIRYYGILAPGVRRTLRQLRAALLADLANLEPLLTRLRHRRRNPQPRPCLCCGGRTFVRTDFTSPNRRAPPWQCAA
jgi:hypothetical protein